MNVDNIRDHLLTAPSEYSYFDTGRFGGWAGPRHWKFKPLQRHGGPSVVRSSAHAQQPDGDEEISAKRKKTALKHLDEVHDFLMLLETSLDQLMSNGSTALDRLEKNMSQPKRAIQLVKKTMENWEEERVVLPKDLHYKVTFQNFTKKSHTDATICIHAFVANKKKLKQYILVILIGKRLCSFICCRLQCQ